MMILPRFILNIFYLKIYKKNIFKNLIFHRISKYTPFTSPKRGDLCSRLPNWKDWKSVEKEEEEEVGLSIPYFTVHQSCQTSWGSSSSTLAHKKSYFVWLWLIAYLLKSNLIFKSFIFKVNFYRVNYFLMFDNIIKNKLKNNFQYLIISWKIT